MFKQIIICALFCLLPVAVNAGFGAGAINMTYNTSVRANAMGEAGVAVAWGEDTNHWANPALLAFRPGVHYLSHEAKMAFGHSSDIVLTNEELTFGAYGVTFLLAKGPVDGNFLDMGLQEGMDENGESLGTFQSYMQSKSWGLGVDGVEVLERVLGRRSGSWTKYFSIAGGATWYDFYDQMAPDWMEESFADGAGEGSAMNVGYVARVTPLDLSPGAGILDNGFLGLSLSGSYGASILNKTDDQIYHVDAAQSDPFPTAYVSGWAANAQITWADDMREKLNDIGFGILGDMINPIVSFTKNEQLIEPGYVWNGEEQKYDYEHDTSGKYDQIGRGWELGLFNVFFIREGNVLEKAGDANLIAREGKTEGGGWKIQAGRYGGFRKDWTDVPQYSGLPNNHWESWSVWVNPLAIYDGFFSN